MNLLQLEQHLKTRFGKTRRSGTSYIRIPCPTCAPRDRNKMKRCVPYDGPTSHCFICHVLMEVQDLVGDNVIVSYEPRTQEEKERDEQPDPRSLVLPGARFIRVNELPQDHPAVQFLRKDHLFDLDFYADVQEIVFCPADSGLLLHPYPYTTTAERLIFPVKYGGKLVGWQARALPGTFYGDRKDCVKHYQIFSKGNYLYNYDLARQHPGVVVVEGVKKALKFGEVGVATFGSGISARQKEMISQWKQIVVMLDGEDHNGTQQSALRMVEGLRIMGKDAINIDLRNHGAVSPDDLPRERLHEIVEIEWKKQHA